MLICVSRSYKMSSNCRLEANYGLQREIAMVPLMMEEGYVPDGWLGLLLGTRMWYPMYGEAVARADVFEERMVALSRDLGDRGKVQTDGATSLAGDNEMVAGLDAARLSAQKAELGMLRLSVMKKRAVALGVSSEQLEAVDDSQNPKEALIELLLELQKGRPSDAENSTSVRRREELTRLKASEVRRCAVSAGATSVDLDAADDSPDAKAFLIDLTISLEMSAERADSAEVQQGRVLTVASSETELEGQNAMHVGDDV